jgi:tetratricopeptide (TPR) repeat protein
MPFRFFRRLRIARGLTLNLSKRGVSVSAGPQGARFTMGTSGTRATAGLTGTGLHYTLVNPHKKLVSALKQNQAGESDHVRASAPLPKLGWLQRLSLSSDVKLFIEGWQAWGRTDIDQALTCFNEVPVASKAWVDAAWSAALLYVQREQLTQAAALLQRVLNDSHALGQTFREQGFTPRVQVPVTPEIVATMLPVKASAQLLLAEVQQSMGEHTAALKTLSQALPAPADSFVPSQLDPVMVAAFGELALESQDIDAMRHFNALAAALGNDSPVHTVVMYYRAQALFEKKLYEAALAVLTPALRRTRDRNPALLLNIRFLRAQTYGALNRAAQARREFERIYAEDPAFEGVREALGLPPVP